MQGVPTRFQGKCEFCGGELDTRAAGEYQYTGGWVMNRTGGGAHGVSLSKRENRWAHGYCIERAIRGHLKQESML